MLITNSPDITNLSVQATFDISGTLPAVNLVNLSTGSGLANCFWAFVVTSPSGTFIHDGDINSPDISGTWSTHVLSDAWPRPFSQIEWSGAPYNSYVICKDSNGNIFTGVNQPATICRPAGNTSTSKNTYGLAAANVSVKCQEGRVYFEDNTYHSYKGSDGTQIASSLTVVYPIDETATIPPKFVATNFTTALVPISYSSNNYQFLQYSVYDYDFGNNTLVRIRYQTLQTFAVWCNVDLMPLICEYNKLIDSVQNGSCTDVNAANQILSIISPKMVLLFMGVLQPLTGVDVPALIEEIKTIGNWDCDCCSAASGIIPQTSSIVDGYNFLINKVCGDINGTVTTNGYNITFNLQDVSYVVTIATESPSETTAFSFEPTVAGCQKTYALKIDGHQLAYDILNIIKSDSALVNLFNSIVNVNTGNFTLLVDGKCIFRTSSSCDYTFTLNNIPASGTFAILTGISGNTLNFAFNEANLTALQSYLNALGYGTFVVTNPSANVVVLTSTGNTNNLTSVEYNVASTNYSAAMTRNCTGYTPLSANQVVQNIIDYLCGITDADIETAADYTICYVDPISKIKQQVTVSAGASLADFITELLARGCNTVDYVLGLSATTCAAIKALFPGSIKILQPSDVILGTKQGDCAGIGPVELGTKILQYGLTDVDFMTALCAAVTACGGGSPCAAFNYFYLTVPYASPSDDTMDIIVNFDLPAASSFTIRYARIDNTNTPTYITIPSVLLSPYTISGVASGQYFVGITPVYADGRKCPEMTHTTPACTGINSFSAILGGSPIDEFVISYSASVSLPKVKVNIAYPNGGSWSQIYNNTGTDINVAFPPFVYGSFSISMQPVCNEDTGFFGPPTAPVILTVSDPASGGGATSATLTFSFVNAPSFTNFQATLNNAIDGNIVINRVFADGFPSPGCAGGTSVSSAEKNSNMTILAGNIATGANPDVISGVWSSANYYSMYNVIINGLPHLTGDVIVVGSASVTIVIPACN